MRELKTVLFSALFWVCHFALASGDQGGGILEEILAGIEQCYAGAGFSARFEQTSILKAMDIRDSASGTMVIKRPGKMYWEYRTPETQLIITDGNQLWIYRPEDNQVTLGEAPALFGEGRGAGFLSDMGAIRRLFHITLENQGDTHWVLKLVPKEKSNDVTTIHLTVDTETFIIREIVTYNVYGDETLIALKDIRFLTTITDDRFTFNIPPGADVIQLDAQGIE